MQNVFEFRNSVIREYESYSRSFVTIRAADIAGQIDGEYKEGRYWPDPLIQINPGYKRCETVQQLVIQGLLHPECGEIFKLGKSEGQSKDMQLYQHQLEAIAKARSGRSYVLTTGTGSGKSMAFFIPIIDKILRGRQADPKPRTRAIIIYPMNALANSQLEELKKFLHGFPEGQRPFTVERYTGQENSEERLKLANNPPDILLTNFMMLELILTRYDEKDCKVIKNCHDLEFIVLDELHTYRGRQGADVAMLVRRVRQRTSAKNLLCIGTSATMANTGSSLEQQATVAQVASKLFGTSITPDDIITETLERITNPALIIDSIKAQLPARLKLPHQWENFDEFRNDPLAVWVELNMGISLNDLNKPARARPITLRQAADKLAEDTGVDKEEAITVLQSFLINAHSSAGTGVLAPFAFKLHQFISGPGKVHTTLEPEGTRQITLDAQIFAPGRQNENVKLFSTYFCRACGHEYHPVWFSKDEPFNVTPRQIEEVAADDSEQAYGFITPAGPEQAFQGDLLDLPEQWLEEAKNGNMRVKSTYKKFVPHLQPVNPQGMPVGNHNYWLTAGKFRFCVNCGQNFDAAGKDINRLAGLSGEGRSSATTMLTLSMLRHLFADRAPEHLPDPRKLLGFVDNRQDAALQAGHFNDFIFLVTLRGALIKALQANNGSLFEENLAEEVYQALAFDNNDPGILAEFLVDPTITGTGLANIRRVLRFVLGYRLLNDLRRGWRNNNPNLDQLGLLRISCRHVDEFAGAASEFKNEILQRLLPAQRAELLEFVIDQMRQTQCIQSRYFNPNDQEKTRTAAFSGLNERWSFSLEEHLTTTKYLTFDKIPDKKPGLRAEMVSGGQQSRLHRSLKAAPFWQQTEYARKISSIKSADLVEMLTELLQIARKFNIVDCSERAKGLTGWALNAAALQWQLQPENPVPGTGKSKRINTFFRELYLNLAEVLGRADHPLFEFEAHEHTAQVDADRRENLEKRFRYTRQDRESLTPGQSRLPVLYCSPTMELGVDISSLNTVYLRNVPPTPANYAQRSGRAGRSGQPAMVIAYCAAMSPHDQWYFRNPAEMVHGIVKAPTLDLTNPDLIKSHMQAVWLANVETELSASIAPLLELEKPGKPVKDELMAAFTRPEVIERSVQQVSAILDQLAGELNGQAWYSPAYARKVVTDAPAEFDRAIDRWRNLLEATLSQQAAANAIASSFTASPKAREDARRRFNDATRQFEMLLKSGNTFNSDFYTYRYLASQGFLPGYNFPRLPLMAWIPPTEFNARKSEGNMVARPRFLALSEFGPLSLIYHEGRTFRVTRAKLRISNTDHVSSGSTLATVNARICPTCGYGHLGSEEHPEATENVCDACRATLTDNDRVNNLYRIETVETTPTQRISINDEERQRQGYDLQTTYRFHTDPDGLLQKIDACLMHEENLFATLNYGAAARIWRINKGWRRRKEEKKLGFYINPLTGLWSKNDQPGGDQTAGKTPDPAEADKTPNQLIVPFVEDHRNILILKPAKQLELKSMTTLQAAIKRGIEQTFQIEESELVAEALPGSSTRNSILFYEAAEGGAGVLTRLATEPGLLALVAREALKLMHYDLPESYAGEDIAQYEVRSGRNADTLICEAGCYRCLLSYYNQPDHENIDRRDAEALDFLVAMSQSAVSRGSLPPADAGRSPAAGERHQIVEAIAEAGLRSPELTDYTVDGRWRVPAYYKQARHVLLESEPEPELKQYLTDRSCSWLVIPDRRETWAAWFAENQAIFGKGDKKV